MDAQNTCIYTYNTFINPHQPPWRTLGSIGSSGEEVLLDHNAILREHGYVSVGVVKLSHDHAWLAYTVDTSGDDTYDAGECVGATSMALSEGNCLVIVRR